MNRIAELRKEKRMSQISLGMKLNVSQKMISAYENGINEPSIDLLMRMADIFHASIDYIVGYSDNRYPEYRILNTSYPSPSAKDMDRLFNDLSDRNKWIAQGVLLGLLASQQAEPAPADGLAQFIRPDGSARSTGSAKSADPTGSSGPVPPLQHFHFTSMFFRLFIVADPYCDHPFAILLSFSHLALEP